MHTSPFSSTHRSVTSGLASICYTYKRLYFPLKRLYFSLKDIDDKNQKEGREPGNETGRQTGTVCPGCLIHSILKEAAAAPWLRTESYPQKQGKLKLPLSQMLWLHLTIEHHPIQITTIELGHLPKTSIRRDPKERFEVWFYRMLIDLNKHYNKIEK